MSPSTFKFQVAQLQSEITRCIEFCEDIRANRNLTGTKNLDQLQNDLEAAEISIPNNFNTFRRLVGPQMDTGDDKARREMAQHILDVQEKMKPRLKEISQPSRRTDKHERQKPGFRDLLSEWQFIYQDVSTTMRSMSGRAELAATPKPTPKPTPEPKKPEPKPKNTDEVTITLKEFDHLLQHMRNSWEEVIISGEIIYVNTFDKKKRQHTKPENAFIKGIPSVTRSSRTPSWEQPRRRVKIPSWETDRW